MYKWFAAVCTLLVLTSFEDASGSIDDAERPLYIDVLGNEQESLNTLSKVEKVAYVTTQMEKLKEIMGKNNLNLPEDLQRSLTKLQSPKAIDSLYKHIESFIDNDCKSTKAFQDIISIIKQLIAAINSSTTNCKEVDVCRIAFVADGSSARFEGRVVDSNGTALLNVKVLYQSCQVFTWRDGSFRMTLPRGLTEIVFSADKYAPTIGKFHLYGDYSSINVVVLTLSNANSGSATGNIADAMKAASLGNAKITLSVRAGINITSGDILRSIDITDSTWALKDITAGTYTMYFTGSGFHTVYRQINIESDKSSSVSPTFMSPTLNSSNKELIRIVLTWDAIPADMDAHLILPTASGSKLNELSAKRGDDHGYLGFSNVGDTDSEYFATLNANAQKGFGPETITIYKFLEGTYTYYVKQLSSSALGDILLSRASVKVYQQGEVDPIYVFYCPVNGSGRAWNAFSFSGDANGKFKIVDFINEIVENDPFGSPPAFVSDMEDL